VISSRATRSQAIRQLATSIGMVFCCMILPVGCGDTGVQKSNMPSAEDVDKLAKEHPERFIRKSGKNKTEVLEGRDRRTVIRQEQDNVRQGTQ
jgi:hypothetical protein